MQDYQATLKAISNFIGSQHPDMLRIFLAKYKGHLSNKVSKYYRNTVAYGPFKGLKFVEESHWSASDRGGMILGLYEQEILNELKTIPQHFSVFIDLGAADGYYGVGVLVGGLFAKSYCFELNEIGRSIIGKNAETNSVASRVVVKAEATKQTIAEIPQDERNSAVLFVDIEGGEFELFDASIFHNFKKSIIFVEIHDFFYKDGKEKLKKLVSDSELTHHVKEIRMGARNLSVFPELHAWNDFDRWILCAEGRAQLMTWLRFDPMT